MKLTSYQYIDGSWSAPLAAVTQPDRTLVLAFGAPERDVVEEAVAEVIGVAGDAPIVGCSTSGEIYKDFVYDKSVSVAVCEFDATRVRSAVAEISEASESKRAGQDIANALNADDLRAVLVFSDGLCVNGTDLAHGIRSVLGQDVSVTGGLAGDGPRFESTWVIAEGALKSGRVVAAGLYGDKVEVGHGSRGGWDPFGPQRSVTRAEGNVLFELDGKPALALYKEYLGERAAELPASGLLFPLQLRSPDGETVLVRTILAVDDDANSLTFAGDIPVGWSGQLMKANFDRLVEGAEGASELARADGDFCGDTLQVAVSCVGRRLVLGERTDEELEATMEDAREGTTQVGFYSYGELSPIVGGGCELHNQTMTITTVVERE